MYILETIYIPTWILLPLFVVLSLYLYTKYKQSYFKRLGIASPEPDLYWGHLKIMLKDGIAKLDMDCAEKYGNVFGTFYGNHPSLVICDPEIIKEITIKQFSKFYDRGEPVLIPKRWRSSVNNARGAKWKYLRSIIQPTFSSGKIKNMRPILKKCLMEFTDAVDRKLESSEDHVIEMYDMFKALTMDVICSTAFGIEVNSQKNPNDQFVKYASEVLGATVGNKLILLNFFFPELRRIIMFFGRDWVNEEAIEFLTRTVKQAMQERRKGTEAEFPDLLKLMMDTHTQNSDYGTNENATFEEMKMDGMSEDDIVINGIIFLAAGYETTAILLSWMTFCLATNPECQNRLFSEIEQNIGADGEIAYDDIMKMEYLDMVTQETLRLYTPAARFNREARFDVTIKNQRIPKGVDVTFSTWAMHRNRKYWKEPEKFDPERFSPANKDKIIPYSYIPFGAGPRNCVGMKLALAEAKMAIVTFLKRVHVEPSKKLEIPPNVVTGGNLARPADGIWVKLVKRQA